MSINISLTFVLKDQIKYSFIGTDNGLVPARRQAIIWTNDGQFTDAYMRLPVPICWKKIPCRLQKYTIVFLYEMFSRPQTHVV